MLHPLPFTTFGEIIALGLKAMVYCPGCYVHRPVDPTAKHIRYTRNICGCHGSVEIKPSVLLPVGGENPLAFLSCGTCLPPWAATEAIVRRMLATPPHPKKAVKKKTASKARRKGAK
jgi:hypothetical protein